jgi:GDP-L-fucose synthase
MNKNSKIYIAGNTGLVGSSILKNLKSKGYTNFIFTPFSKYDLINQKQVEDFFEREKPEYIFLAAARVGGIVANNTYRAQFIYENLMIQNNIIHSAYKFGSKKLLFLGSSCIYPKFCPQPMKEEYLLSSELEYTNEPYAIAKIAGIKTIESYNLQYGTNFISVMPTNLYGTNDNFDLEKSHVLPAMIRKMHLGKCLMNNDWKSIRYDFNKNPVENIDGQSKEEEISTILAKYGIYKVKQTVQIELWGTGTPRREFLYAEDLADACVYLMETLNFNDILEKSYNIKNYTLPITNCEIKNTHINIGVGKDFSINELSHLIKQIVQYTGDITWNINKPDGTPQKLLDVSKLNKYGWYPKVELGDGISTVYKSYINVN